MVHLCTTKHKMTPNIEDINQSKDNTSKEIPEQSLELISDFARLPEIGGLGIWGNFVNLGNNMQQLLAQISSQNLETLTHIQLKIISQDISLQQLSIFTPVLSKLTLDGSIISTLRDLGCGFGNLKILSINRCHLRKLDSLFGLDTLEELHASDNYIEDISPCIYLTNVKTLNFARNDIQKIRALAVLKLCPQLEHIYLKGNKNLDNEINYRFMIQKLLPDIVSLDGIQFEENMEQNLCNLKNRRNQDL